MHLMNSLYVIVAALANVALIGTVGATTLQQTFAIGDPGIVPGTAKGHGEDVSRQAYGNPDDVPEAAMGHGEEVSDVARSTR
jgi:hypothetical protein